MRFEVRRQKCENHSHTVTTVNTSSSRITLYIEMLWHYGIYRNTPITLTPRPQTHCVTVLTRYRHIVRVLRKGEGNCASQAPWLALSFARRRATERRWAYISSVSGAALLWPPSHCVRRSAHHTHTPHTPHPLALICSKACCCSCCMRADVLSTIVRWPPHTNCGLRDRQSP